MALGGHCGFRSGRFATTLREGWNGSMPRKTDGCVNCGEVREMAAHGLCFRCYRREGRAGEGRVAGIDRYNPGIRREHKKLFRGFTSVMVGLSDLGVSNDDVMLIRDVIGPYLSPICRFLRPVPAQDESESGGVNGEQHLDICSPFTQGPM